MKKRALYSAGHRIFTFTALAISYPIYSILSGAPTYFVALRIPPAAIFLFVLILSFLLPLSLTLIVALSNIGGDKFRWVVESCLVSALAGMMFLNLLNGSGLFWPAIHLLIPLLLLTIAFAHQYVSNNSFRSALIFLFPLAFVVPLQFVADSQMRPVLFPRDAAPQRDITFERRPPVFVVIWDELSLLTLLDAGGRIDRARFPNFAELADSSTWYANATTVSFVTELAVPAILTGNFPPPFALKGAPTGEKYPVNMFSVLGSRFDIHAYEPLTQLHSVDREDASEDASEEYRLAQPVSLILTDAAIIYLRAILPSGVADYLRVPAVTVARWGGFKERGRPLRPWVGGEQDWELGRGRAAEEFIREIDEYPAQTFHFLHLMLPHRPSAYLPSGMEYDRVERWAAGREYGQAYVIADEHAHRLQVAFADKLLGSLIGRLKRAGLFDKSLIVVTSDHGLSYQVGEPARYPTSKNFAEVAFVPLFIKYPGQRTGEIDTTNVQSVDIFPTILDVLGENGTIQCDGRSLLDPSAEIPALKSLFAEGPHRYESGFDRPEIGSWGPWKDRKGNETLLFGDEVLRLSEEEYLKSRDELSRLKVESFSLNDPRATLWRYGPGLEFIGESYAALRKREIACQIESEQEHLPFNQELTLRLNVKLDGRLPALLSGEVSGFNGEASELLVIVGIDGVVQAAAQLYDARGGIHFELFLPEEVFDHEINEAEIMVIR